MTVEGKRGVATPHLVRSGKQTAVRSSIKEDRRQLLIGAGLPVAAIGAAVAVGGPEVAFMLPGAAHRAGVASCSNSDRLPAVQIIAAAA